jgi:hypothetical protein
VLDVKAELIRHTCVGLLLRNASDTRCDVFWFVEWMDFMNCGTERRKFITSAHILTDFTAFLLHRNYTKIGPHIATAKLIGAEIAQSV